MTDTPDNIVSLSAHDPRPRTVPDPGLRELAISWIQKIQKPHPTEHDVCRITEIANGIIDTPSTTVKGVIYKLGAACAGHLIKVDGKHQANDPVALMIYSAMTDLERLKDS